MSKKQQTFPEISDFIRPFRKEIQMITRHSTNHVFSDFLSIAIYCAGLSAYEKEYLDIVKRYNKQEVEHLTKAFAQMIMITENNGAGFRDLLGEYFMNEITHGRNGEFFTPQHVCDSMAICTGGEKQMLFRNILDPAAGSGRMLMAMAKNVGPHNHFYGIDVNLDCVKMCALNMWMHMLPGYAIHGNSLSAEAYGGYHIEIVFKNKMMAPKIIVMSREEAQMLMPPLKTKMEPVKELKAPIPPGADLVLGEKKQSAGNQLTIF